jgi:hypothetical protein
MIQDFLCKRACIYISTSQVDYTFKLRQFWNATLEFLACGLNKTEE